MLHSPHRLIDQLFRRHRIPKARLSTVGVALAYLALAVLFTWPLALHLGTAFPSADPWYGGDPHTFIWYLDWLAKGLTGHTALTPAKMMFYPNGINPWAGYDGILMAIVGVPAVLVSGNPILAYNLVILVSFVAAAMAAYALVLALSRSTLAAGFAGFAYGFSTYQLVRGLQHPNLCLTMAIPLLFLAAWRFGENPNTKNAWWLAGAVLLNGLTSFYYHIGGLVFLAVAAVYYQRRLRRNKNASLSAGILVAVAAALPALPILLNRQPELKTHPLSFVANMGADPLNFFLPHPLTNVFGHFTQGAYDRLPPVFWGGYNLFEITSYIGLPLLLLFVVWLWRRRVMAVPAAGLWAAAIPVFLILAFGTELRLDSWHLPMPLLYLRSLFPFSLVRSPNRMFIFALLAMIVLASFAVAHLRSLIKKRFWLIVAFVTLFAFMVAERAIFPYPLFANQVSEFYKNIAQDQEVYAIADLPITYPGISEYDYYQTVHGKPIVDGEFFYPAYSPQTTAFITDNALLANAVCRSDTPAEIVLPDRATTLAQLRDANVRYAIIHHLILHNTPNCAYAQKYLRAFFSDTKPVFTDGTITVYELP
ncbi:MAG: hypothetical protein PHT12_02020 [Patescibacteria group bacterium]|nr:hypothetical protein [Patescibacteria group bacterium]